MDAKVYFKLYPQKNARQGNAAKPPRVSFFFDIEKQILFNDCVIADIV